MLTMITSAHADLDVAAERARIARERAAAQQKFAHAQADCARRFVVTSCSDAATKERRETLESLRRQTLTLDDSERRQQAARRLVSIDEKRRAQAALQASRPSGATQPAASAEAPTPHASEVPRPRPPPDARAAALEQRQRAAAARRRVDDRAARLQEAEDHRKQVERRNAERARSGSKAAALASPASAASPGATLGMPPAAGASRSK